ncbi:MULTISPECIES: hypothetical protein [unclassified Vibrio]|uniref:Uncharacterized protein n=1 Tax=Vibrio sp. HB236076 TaxID=3232307 RepID=A0AB39HHN1_9VIBR|nr:hypothetical protein [Vibrio sp. HB161653]MDP5255120.1 hypothetical protein [Vibrio sp. HB161653]
MTKNTLDENIKTHMKENQITEMARNTLLHCEMCRVSYFHMKNTPIGSSIGRLIQLEKKLSVELIGLSSVSLFVKHIDNVNYYHDFDELIIHTEKLISDFKYLISSIENKELAKKISYWLAAIQIELDQIKNYL